MKKFNPLLITHLIISDIMNGKHEVKYEDGDSVFYVKQELKLSEDELEKVRSMSKKERKAYMKKRKEEFLNEQGKTNAN